MEGRPRVARIAVQPLEILRFLALLVLTTAVLLVAAPLRAADRDKIDAFLTVTGFDVAIESLQLRAASPAEGYVDAFPFARSYSRLAMEVFEPALLKARALDHLEEQMTDAQLHAGAELYASDFGQRVVAAENSSHLTDYETKLAQAEPLFRHLQQTNPQRLRAMEQMMEAISNDDMIVAGQVEVTTRFLMAAGRIGGPFGAVDEAELRANLAQALRAQIPLMREASLKLAAYTYRDISDEDFAAYAEGIMQPEIVEVYDVLNRVQYQVMIEFYEKFGERLAELAPETDL